MVTPIERDIATQQSALLEISVVEFNLERIGTTRLSVVGDGHAIEAVPIEIGYGRALYDTCHGIRLEVVRGTRAVHFQHKAVAAVSEMAPIITKTTRRQRQELVCLMRASRVGSRTCCPQRGTPFAFA